MQFHGKNVAINDVLPLKAARRDAIANLKCFGTSDAGYLILMVIFTFTMRRHFGRLASAAFISSRLVGFGFRVQRVGSTMQNSQRVGENFDPILSCLWTEAHEIFRRCGKPVVLSDALFRLSVPRFRRYSSLNLEVVEKRSKCKSFWPPIFVGGTLRLFYSSLLGRLSTHYLAKFGWVPFADFGLRSLAVKQNAELTQGR